MKKFPLGSTDLSQYDSLTEDERKAWLHPAQGSYQHFHVERMGVDTYRWRDSATPNLYIGSFEELCKCIWDNLQCRKLTKDYREVTTPINLLSQKEIDDLFEGL